MTVAGLKDPPRFVKSEWAWAYTLDKLRAKDMLDEHGNPSNYAAASAIYKRVEAKYTDAELQSRTALPDSIPAMSRSEVIAFDMPEWVVMRGFAWAANPDAHLRLDPQGGGDWIAERYTTDGIERGQIEQDTAEWLVRNSAPGVQAWVAAQA